MVPRIFPSEKFQTLFCSCDERNRVISSVRPNKCHWSNKRLVKTNHTQHEKHFFHPRKKVPAHVKNHADTNITYSHVVVFVCVRIEPKKKTVWDRETEKETNHMYSAITFSVVSERLRLMRSESRDISKIKQRPFFLQRAEKDLF